MLALDFGTAVVASLRPGARQAQRRSCKTSLHQVKARLHLILLPDTKRCPQEEQLWLRLFLSSAVQLARPQTAAGGL